MAARIPKSAFSKGELSDELQARFDVDAYQSAVKRARNVIILKYGGLTMRPGTQLVAQAYDQVNPIRLIPFEFSLEQEYVLEMGQGYMRPATGGGMVVEGELAISAITNAPSAVVSAAFHGYVVGDQVYFSGVQGMTQINGKIGTVTGVPGTGAFIVNLDSTNWGTFTGAAGGATNAGPPPAPPAAPVVPPVVAPPPPPRTVQPYLNDYR